MVTWNHGTMSPIWSHFYLQNPSWFLDSLDDGGVEGGADGGDVQVDGTERGVGVDERRHGGVGRQVVQHHVAQVGDVMEGGGRGQVAGGGHLDMGSLCYIQKFG